MRDDVVVVDRERRAIVTDPRRADAASGRSMSYSMLSIQISLERSAPARRSGRRRAAAERAIGREIRCRFCLLRPRFRGRYPRSTPDGALPAGPSVAGAAPANARRDDGGGVDQRGQKLAAVLRIVPGVSGDRAEDRRRGTAVRHPDRRDGADFVEDQPAMRDGTPPRARSPGSRARQRC